MRVFRIVAMLLLVTMLSSVLVHAQDRTRGTIAVTICASLSQSCRGGRNQSAMVYVAPGGVSGIGTGDQNPSISGGTGFENLTVIDGVNVTNPVFGAVGSYNRVHGPLGTGIN